MTFKLIKDREMNEKCLQYQHTFIISKSILDSNDRTYPELHFDYEIISFS